jgi:hypothetical protein
LTNYKYNRLPLIEKILKTSHIDIDLSQTYIIACQHVLPSLHLMIESFIDFNLPNKNVFILGKCYSTSITTYKNLRKDGIYVDENSLFFDSHISFEEQYKQNIVGFIKTIDFINIANSGKKLIIFDDGGELVKYINSISCDHSNIIAVEQTSSGYNKIKDLSLKFPIINAARSYAKLVYESPFIAKSLMDQIINKLSEHKIILDKALILGNGAIGNALYNNLFPICHTDTYDVDTKLSNICLGDTDISNYNLIIGATGFCSIPNINYKNFTRKTLLISASSGDIEFNAVTLRLLKEKYNNCHNDIILNNYILASSGFPINFHRMDKDNIPLEYIQLTFSLMFFGVCYFYNTKLSPDLYDIPNILQNNILYHFNELKNNVIL